MFSVYYTSTMYCITITAENASNNMKYLTRELRQKLGKYAFIYFTFFKMAHLYIVKKA